MSRLDHFLVLYRCSSDAPVFSGEERSLLAQTWTGLEFIERDPFLIAWLGPAAADERAPLLRILGDAYNVGTARPADIAAGIVEAAGELDGAFAAFAFNSATAQCTLVTDRFGLLPLYVHEQDGTLCYSTSLALLLSLRQPVCTIDPLCIYEMLTLQMVLGNRTFFREIGMVAPATALHLCSGPPKPAAYWSWRSLGPTANMEANLDLVHETYALIEQTVMRGVPANVTRVALPLDGGLDSRLLLAVLTRNDVPVQAYHTGPEDEAGLARDVARALGAPLSRLPVRRNPSNIPEAHRAIDCVYHADRLWGWEMAQQAAEQDGCDVLFDSLAFDDILGAPPRTAGETAVELARVLEAEWAELDEENIVKAIGEDASATMFPAVRASLRTLAEEAIEQAGPRAPDLLAMTNRVRKHAFGACLANLPHLPGRFPFVTTRLFEHCIQLPPALRLEHNLYCQIYRELFPDLARIPWTRTGAPLDRSAPMQPPRWRRLLRSALRLLPRRRVEFTGHGSFDVDFRNRELLREVFFAVLDSPTPGLEGVLPTGVVSRVVERQLAGRNLGGLLQGLYTIKHFLMRFPAPKQASVRASVEEGVTNKEGV